MRHDQPTWRGRRMKALNRAIKARMIAMAITSEATSMRMMGLSYQRCMKKPTTRKNRHRHHEEGRDEGGVGDARDVERRDLHGGEDREGDRHVDVRLDGGVSGPVGVRSGGVRLGHGAAPTG
jgi:hypothetical protein